MLNTIIAVFALAAILGMTLLSYVLKGRQTPRALMVVHGLFAATGLGLLLYYLLSDNGPGPVESGALFGIAALGGFVMAFKDISGKPVPKWLAVVHGLIAVAGFIMLIMFAAGNK